MFPRLRGEKTMFPKQCFRNSVSTTVFPQQCFRNNVSSFAGALGDKRISHMENSQNAYQSVEREKAQ